MTHPVWEQRKALGTRLRKLRQTAHMTGAELARQAGWHQSKVSKIEYGRKTLSEADIRAYCEHTGATDQLPELLATRHDVEVAYQDWRESLGLGPKRRQNTAVSPTGSARVIRDYSPMFVPAFLQTAEYATLLIQKAAAYFQTPIDVEAAVAERIQGQQHLYWGAREFHFLIGEHALYTIVGHAGVQAGQLDRLLAVASLPRVTLGIVPATDLLTIAPFDFAMFDEDLVILQTIATELRITQPPELALYGQTFEHLAEQSATGKQARALILAALGADVPPKTPLE